uniref:NADH-ubiquinone oxidoreductase chain 6 n=1 Tax=Grammomys selousi TaxID=2781600 RepID=A0A7S6PTI5_9MURI|nr:NADH dehydrogenase subunit 6 [Grammomys selousi]QOU09800.1 NADH dehydrogenase subunit 6 [Grammomys selousi]
MMDYIFIFSLLFLIGCVGLALKPSPIYGGLCLIISGFVGCFMVMGSGGSFLGLMVFLIYLGGMMVVFGYTTAMATEEYPETWASNWLIFSFLVMGFLMELFLGYLLDCCYEVELIDLAGLSDWVMYEVDDMVVMLEGGAGVASIYNCVVWMMALAGWSLFAGIFIIIEITRD